MVPFATAMTEGMTVTLVLPAALRDVASGREELFARAASVREALTEIENDYPPLVRCILTRDGQLRPFVNLFVREQDVRALDGLDTRLQDGDRVLVVASVAGG